MRIKLTAHLCYGGVWQKWGTELTVPDDYALYKLEELALAEIRRTAPVGWRQIMVGVERRAAQEKQNA